MKITATKILQTIYTAHWLKAGHLFLLILLITCCYTPLFAQQPSGNGGTIVTALKNVEELQQYTGTGTTVIVTDSGGGIFNREVGNSKAVDMGVVFPSGTKGYNWVRLYNEAQGVNISWFYNRVKNTTGNTALGRALRYNLVNIDREVLIDSSLVLPGEQTIVFGNNGSFNISAMGMVEINAYVRANDYAHIFYGTGKVIFGNTAVPHVSVCWFGAVADCIGFEPGRGSDNTAAIQNAIAAAGNVSEVFLPGSPASHSYRITSAITISKAQHFFSFKFYGGGTTITQSRQDRASSIFADFTSGPAINIQGSRRVYITDLLVHGKNDAPRTVWNTKMYGQPAADSAVGFISPGIKSDYTGITTDAEKDNIVWSADIVFDRLQIEGFYLGLGISQAGHLQGDRMRVEHTQINDCTYGVSIGNPQNRACHFLNLDMNHIWCCFTNNTFASRTGSEFQITGGQWCNCYKLFHMQPYNLGQCVVSGVYAENIGSIGEIGYGSTNNNSFLFTGCNFMLQDDGGMGGKDIYAKYYTLTSYANLSFVGCNFRTARPYLAMYAGYLNGYSASGISLTGCTFYNTRMLHVWGNSNIESSYIIPNSNAALYSRTLRMQLDGGNRYNTSYYNSTAIAVYDGEYGADKKHAFAQQIVRQIPRFYAIENGRENMIGIKISGDTLRFGYNDKLMKKLFRYVLPGDVLGSTLTSTQTSWDNPSIEILNIDQTTRTVTALLYTNEANLDKIALYTNCFITSAPISGVATEGKDKITDVEFVNALKAGDFITFRQSNTAYRVSAVDMTNKTITLMDPVREKVNGRITLYNQQLVDAAGNNDAVQHSLRSAKDKYVTLMPYDYTLLANTADNDVLVVLPHDAKEGQMFFIKKTRKENKLSISLKDGTIDGQPYIEMTEAKTIQLQFDGKNYVMLSN